MQYVYNVILLRLFIRRVTGRRQYPPHHILILLPRVCLGRLQLRNLLPSKTSTCSSYQLRKRCFPLFSIRSLKTLISIVVYLNMYNHLIVMLCFLSVHIARFMLFVLYFLYFVYFIVIRPCNSVRFSY